MVAVRYQPKCTNEYLLLGTPQWVLPQCEAILPLKVQERPLFSEPVQHHQSRSQHM